jgi:hypothetical protein
MGRRSGRAVPKPKRAGKNAVVAGKPLADEMYDDVDKFHKDNDLRFESEIGDDDEELDEEEEEGVMDLDDSEEADSDDDLEAGGQLAKSMLCSRTFMKFSLHSCCCLCGFRAV